MKLKYIIIALFVNSAINAQDFIMKKELADRYYNKFDYFKAITMYEELLKSYPYNYELHEKLADSYRRTSNYEKSVREFAILTDTSEVRPEYLLYYGQALAQVGNYSEASFWYKKYSEVVPSDSRGKDFTEVYQNPDTFYKNSASYILNKASFNSDKSDFSPAYFQDGLVFSTDKSDFSIIRILYNWTYSSYLDLHFVLPDSTDSKPFSKNINSIYHDGPVCFNPTQDTCIFTRSNFYHLRFKKSADGINKLKLYQAVWNNALNSWSQTEPLPFNSDQYSVGHPALADNGQTLYFASDMPGGFGGTDIYVTHRTIDSTGRKSWDKPVNLGTQINSPGNEMFPFVDSENNLYFASNGIAGMGGLDIFFAKKSEVGFEKPTNLGSPINSRFDDFGLICKNGGISGYLSTNRDSAGNDDIYYFSRNNLKLKGVVFDSINRTQPLQNSLVKLLTKEGAIDSINTDASGKFEFPLEFNKKYQLLASLPFYSVSMQNLSTENVRTSELTSELHLAPVPVKLFCTIADKKSGEKLSDVQIIIVDTVHHSTIAEAVTSTDGGFSKIVPDVRINDKLGYAISVSKKGFLNKSIAFGHLVTSPEVNLNDFLEIALDKIDVGTDIGKLLQINPIYFDLGKWDIRPDAASELDKVVKAMKENEGLVIELGSHTDARGSNQSNLVLSDKRAKSSAAYIVSQGIDKSRIFGKGYGESKLINKCADGISCPEAEHAANRRTEFKIVKF